VIAENAIFHFLILTKKLPHTFSQKFAQLFPQKIFRFPTIFVHFFLFPVLLLVQKPPTTSIAALRQKATLRLNSTKGSEPMKKKVHYIKVDDLRPNPMQPRRYFDPEGLNGLADSIRQYGILQPLNVRKQGKTFELIAGERRLRAARMAGLTEVPCLILDADMRESSVIALVENIQRRDLDYIDEAEAIARLIRTYGITQEEAAKRLGKSPSAISNKLRLLKLSPEILYVLRETALSERHARALLRVETNEDRLRCLSQITAQNLNVAQTDELIDCLLDEELGGGSGGLLERLPLKPLDSLHDFPVSDPPSLSVGNAQPSVQQNAQLSFDLPTSSGGGADECGNTVVDGAYSLADALLTELGIATEHGERLKRQKRRIIVKDLRIFINTIVHGLDMLKRSGIAAEFNQNESDAETLLTIRIPR
jgi:ParB family chromosome partitioning protein